MAASKVVRARKKGQITIPDEFRRELGIGEDSLLRVSVRDGELRIAPVEVRERAEAGTDAAEQGSPWLRELYEYFAPVRQEAEEKGYTDEQINEWIGEAVAAHRRERRG
ncbi:MAG: AbrB/MazE/SpoVT family DNA-binding domain-containing protein [Chloroflexota bacterium]|nr:AbrB/MazE/SpoVT family DNA-binding domain-containing protein [Chloroflexota bacterium]